MGWHIPSCWLRPSPPHARGCWGAVLPGGVGALAPLQAVRAGAGRSRCRQSEAGAAHPSQSQLSHCRSQAPCADGCPSARGLCNWGAMHTPLCPEPPLPHTCAPVLVFLLGLFWEQPGACSIPSPRGWSCGGAKAGLGTVWDTKPARGAGEQGDAWGLVHLTVGAAAPTSSAEGELRVLSSSGNCGRRGAAEPVPGAMRVSDLSPRCPKFCAVPPHPSHF